MNAPGRIRGVFWGKTRRDDPDDLHRLEHHLADAAGVMDELLSRPAVERPTARAAGQERLDATTKARLCVLTALHDVGKANLSFQSRAWTDRPARAASHTGDLMPLLNGADPGGQAQLLGALTTLAEALNGWDDRQGAVVCALLLASLSHHGRPVRLQNAHPARPADWRENGQPGSPFSFMADLDGRLRRWFPAAYESDAPPLPSRPALQHHFAGLVTMADWIASNEESFPYEAQDDANYYTQARRQARTAVERTAVATTPADGGDRTPDPQGDPLARALERFNRMRAAGHAERLQVAVATEQDAANIEARIGNLLDRPRASPAKVVANTVRAEHDDDLAQLAAPALVSTMEQAGRSLEPRRYAHLRAAWRRSSFLVLVCAEDSGPAELATAAELLADQKRHAAHGMLIGSPEPMGSSATLPSRRRDRIDENVPFYRPDQADNADVLFNEPQGEGSRDQPAG